MKKKFTVLLLLSLSLIVFGQPPGITKWKLDRPFEQRLFIENKGQCEPRQHQLNSEDIRFSSAFDGLRYYFTENAIWVSHTTMVKRSKPEIEALKKKVLAGIKENEEEEKREKAALTWKGEEEFYCMEFIGSSSNCYIEGQLKATERYNFGIPGKKTSLQASAYHKIIYHELYPGIDMEIIFPKGQAGFKYTFLLHADADPALISIGYPLSKSLRMGNNGELQITSQFGSFTEQAPSVMQGNNAIACHYELKNNRNTFKLGNYDPSQSLVIDPWVMPPFFEGNGGPYDIDWDEAGNCYIHGGSERNVIAPEIVKMDNKGKKLWTYVLTEFGDGIYNYGDFAVDRQTQSVYVISPSEIKWNEVGLKFDANGMKIATYYRDSLMQELWRIAFNSCTHQAVIGGGGLTRPAHQLCFLDTNFVQMKSLPIRNSMNGADDVWGVAIDNAGSCYIGLGKMNWDEPNYKNVLMKLPLPTLSPPTWIVPSYYEFNEGLSNKIRLTGIGYNGICMSADKLYTYDTYVLKKWNTSNGVMQDSIFIDTAVAQSPMYYAGLAADECDNVLMGFENQVLLKDANRNFSTVFTAPTTLGYIYDISLGRNNILYVCGNAFVAAVQLSLPECKPLITTKQVVHSTCNALGSSAIKVSNGTPPYTYSWNTIPLQTGSTAINLIPGTYVVTITDASCPAKIKKDTVVINGNSELQLITTSISTPCNGGTGTAIVSVSNGTWPYTYSWIPVPGSDSMLTNIPAGTYTVTVTDKNGCIKTATIILNKGSNSPVATISATHITCNGDANGTLTANVTGGTPPYTYLWNTGGTGTMITNLKAGSYYLTVTGADGCSITNSVLLTEPLLMQVVIAVTDELCDNGDATAKVKVTGGVMPYTYLWSTGSTADSISKLKAGNYAVTVKDLNGCIKTVAVTVKNNSVNTPKAAFSCKPRLTDIFNSTIQFLDKSTGAIKWQWSFGDGKTAAVQNPVHTYTESGVFIVSLEIFNALECHSIITDTVTIRPFWSFYIPNSFTPDGDGVNDVFNAKAEGVQDFQMTIFNRWGEQIFVTKSLSIPWDGKGNKGTEIPQDVYLYLVILKDSKGVEHRYTGIVSLIK